MGVKKQLTPQQAILDAWSSGKKSVEIDKRLFTLTLQTHHPIVHVSGKNIKVTERWIIARPADGKPVPLYSIGYKNKLRSSLA